MSSNIPVTSKVIVLGNVPKIDERRFVVVILTVSPTPTPKYLDNQAPIIIPFLEVRLFIDPSIKNSGRIDIVDSISGLMPVKKIPLDLFFALIKPWVSI